MVVEGPHRSELDFEEVEPRKYKVMFSPHEPGIYILNVRFADEHVPGIYPVPYIFISLGNNYKIF